MLKVYQDKEDLERNIKVLKVLEQMRIPVGKIVPVHENELYVQYEDNFYFLSEKLQGKNITQIGNDRNLARKMGGIIADLHLAYAKCDENDSFWHNSLFDNGEFSGYIDFDLSQKNIRIFDLCYFMLGLLSEKEKFEITEEVWFEFLKNVFTGYESKIKLTEAEKKAVPYVMECIELLFVSYFASIKDTVCAESAFEIFEFVKKQENRIWKSICKK